MEEFGYNLITMSEIYSRTRMIFKQYPEIWFFLFSNLIFLIMYFWTLAINSKLHDPGPFGLFTGLTIVHIILHWTVIKIEDNPNWFWPYILVQGTMAFGITYLSENMGMIFALYLCLIGEVIGTDQPRRITMPASIFLLSLSMVNFILIMGLDQTLWWVLGITPMLVFVVMYVSLYTQQAKAHQKTQTLLIELEAAHTQLAEYAAQVEELTLTTERQRMARELHDTLAQGLAGLILQLEAADSNLTNSYTQKAQTIIQQAMTRARTTLADARRAIGDLRAELNHADLNNAIKVEVERFQNTTGIPCALDLSFSQPLNAPTAENTLRAISEGLMNIARHAQATRARISVSSEEQGVVIMIRDDGIGMNPEETIGQTGHYGLLGLRERARLLGGKLTVQSHPAKGTTVKIQYPLSDLT